MNFFTFDGAFRASKKVWIFFVCALPVTIFGIAIWLATTKDQRIISLKARAKEKFNHDSGDNAQTGGKKQAQGPEADEGRTTSAEVSSTSKVFSEAQTRSPSNSPRALEEARSAPVKNSVQISQA